MSLGLSVIAKSHTKDTESLKKVLVEEVYITNTYVFGFEIFRKKLWGSEVIKELGCELLYRLKEYDLYLFDEDLFIFKNEVNTILANAALVESRTNVEKEAIENYMHNAMAYIKCAEKNIDITIG